VPLVAPDEVFLFAYGPDNRTAFEREQMQEHGLRAIDVREVVRDPEDAAVRATAAIEPEVDRVLVHLDVDVIDFTDLPLSDNAGRNQGLPFEVALRALRVLLSTPKLAALTVTEVNPDHDPDGSALRRLALGLAEALACAPRLASPPGA
jgi:arginase